MLRRVQSALAGRSVVLRVLGFGAPEKGGGRGTDGRGGGSIKV